MLSEDIYDGIMERDETWFMLENGWAEIIYDCALLDC